MDPYFERAIHGLSKHTEGYWTREQSSPIGTSNKYPPEGIKCPPAGNKCPFLIGARCRRFEEEDTTNFIFECYHACVSPKSEVLHMFQ